MEIGNITLPRLNGLRPSLSSTLYKAVEEAGELARAVLQFLQQGENDSLLLQEVINELLDLAQTCVTMIFVLEDQHGVDIDAMLEKHLLKLAEKGYTYKKNKEYYIFVEDGFRVLCLPKLQMSDVTLLTTVCKIQEELGELTQYLGKYAGASGENKKHTAEEIVEGCALELLDVAQCCFTMMYILADEHKMSLELAVEKHVEKLRKKGYVRDKL